MDFSLIRRAGLTQREFSTLCGVSRVTANLWATGKMAPHRYIRDSIADHLHSLHRALERGHLPLAKGLTRAQRPDALTLAISMPADESR